MSATRTFPDTAITDPAACLICQQEDADPAAIVFRDDLWSCEVIAGFDVPGWFVLRTRRHALGWQELDTVEVSSFGSRVQNLVGAVTDVFDSPATYLLQFGEAYPHFHCLIAARGDDVPPERRVAAIMTLREDHRDRDRSLSFVPEVRAALLACEANHVAAEPGGAR